MRTPAQKPTATQYATRAEAAKADLVLLGRRCARCRPAPGFGVFTRLRTASREPLDAPPCPAGAVNRPCHLGSSDDRTSLFLLALRDTRNGPVMDA